MASERLYYSDSYIQTFRAAVNECTQREDGTFAVILDKTVFYPESGGQLADLGLLDNIQVMDVQEVNGEVVHILQRQVEDTEVTGRIDWARRFDHMQQHSGQHILSGAFYSVLGAQTIGFHMGQESSQIDLDVSELKAEDIKAVEELANSVVFDNSPVKIHFVNEETINKFLVRKMPTKAFDFIRLIQVDDIDCCPCGGTHVARTGEVGLIKVRSWERKNGAVRVDFVCGVRVLADYHQKNDSINKLSAFLSVPAADVDEAVRRQNEKLEMLEKQISTLKEEYFKQLALNLSKQSDNGIITHIIEDAASFDVSLLAKSIAMQPKTIALVGGVSSDKDKAYLAFACSADVDIKMAESLKEVLPLIHGKGGGGAKFAQGGGSTAADVYKALEKARERLAGMAG